MVEPVVAAKPAPKKKAGGAKLPKEKACIPPPTDAGDEGMVASAGLDPDVVRSVMRTAVQKVLPCFAGEASATMLLNVKVACTGQVEDVSIVEDGGASPTVRTCVQEGLKYAEFPAHQLPDGDQFEYPLRYNAPE